MHARVIKVHVLRAVRGEDVKLRKGAETLHKNMYLKFLWFVASAFFTE